MPGAIRTVAVMTETLIGYARCCTDAQDLTAQRDRLRELGVAEDRLYLGHGLTGTTGSPAPPATAPASTRPSPPSREVTPSWCPNSTGSPGPCPTPAPSATTDPDRVDGREAPRDRLRGGEHGRSKPLLGAR